MDQTVAAVRSFNRFYTRLVGALDDRFLGSSLALPEARVLFEIAQAQTALASDLQRQLGLDAGYVSRLLRRLEARGLIRRERGPGDRRRRPIGLTDHGRALLAELDARQRDEVARLLARLAPFQQEDLAAVLATARRLLDPAPAGSFAIRTLRAGDLGMICARQAIFYREAYGWGRGLELNILEAAARYLGGCAPGRDEGWIADVDGAPAGSVLVTDEGEGVARLRLLYVEPFARGLGVGQALVGECLRFAREAGYASVTLWTHAVLVGARRIYAANGFSLVESAMHHEFGKPELGETWRLDFRK